MKRYAVYYMNRFMESYDEFDKAIKCAMGLRDDYTFVDVIDTKTGKVVYTWIY